ncbi:MAG TPA: TIGR03862 family flavoprotein [Xanthobacteraceae bacterium]|nr:TIGR03862 family flavoprotein [Xanthobacteraceae bacterium]
MSAKRRFHAAVVGGGPAGLMAAETLARGGANVAVYERMPSPGRKFLLAGRGGLNLTHSEALGPFLARYENAEEHLRGAIEALPPAALRAWSEELGQETFVGSSGRVFPKAMKASPLLRAWLARLRELGVEFRLRHRWCGWAEGGALLFDTPAGSVEVQADTVVLALGGASWPKLGSDGSWQEILRQKGVAIAPLVPSNSGFIVRWSEIFAERFAGQPLKGIELHFGGVRLRGEAMITRTGIEGSAIYALSSRLRDAIAANGDAALCIDLRPDVTEDLLAKQLSAPRGKQSMSSFLRKSAKLSPPAIGLLQEKAATSGMPLGSVSPGDLARMIKRVEISLIAAAPIERAISTAGGIEFGELDEQFMLRKLPGVFAAGEMLDWEAPTGGYLLQACFATGAAAGLGALRWLKAR